MIVDLNAVSKYSTADYESPISYFRIALYGGRTQFDVAFVNEDDYFDVEYIGFFKTLEEAQAYEFDYQAELKNLEKNYADANGDGEITTLDLVLFMRHLAGWVGYESLAKPKNLDLNLDGEINALDATIMVRKLANWSEYKTVPYLHDYNGYIEYREPLKNSYTKLTQDKKLTVAYLGGSITLGRSYENNCWRTMFDAWLKADYPTAEIKMIHAGIGGTGSSYGAYRVNSDVLAHDPDLVFIEFAANDNHFGSKYKDYRVTKESVTEYYETIIRKIYKHNPEADIVMVYTQTADMTRTTTSIEVHEELAKYYNINSVYFGATLLDYIKENNFESTDYIYDGQHPTDKGYEILTAPLKELFSNIWSDVDASESGEKLLPEKMKSAHDRTDSYLIYARDTEYSSDWTESGTIKTNTPGASLNCKFVGDEISIYASLSSKAGIIEYRIDGGDWIEKSLRAPVIKEKVMLESGLEYGEHTLEIRCSEKTLSTETINIFAILVN